MFCILNIDTDGIFVPRMTGENGEDRMTKADIAEKIYSNLGLSRKESSEMVDLIFEIVRETLENGESVKISGFGFFEVRDKKPRRGRNPQTGEELVLPARRVVSFRPSQVLREEVNAVL
jgi:integration host factor subunit alpha